MRWSWMLLVVAGCGEPEATTPAPSGDGARTLQGTLTWTVVPDDDAQAAGLEPCTYTRSYAAVEDESAPWLCPDCDVSYVAQVALTEGELCFSSIATGDFHPVERVAVAGDGWRRNGREFGRPAPQGTVTRDGAWLRVTNESDDFQWRNGGTYRLRIDGALVEGTSDQDPLHGWVVPDTYACGWEHQDVPAYEGDWVLAIGAPLPDGLFRDACGEPVRLHDFSGRWLILDLSAYDCGPCRNMASGESDFVTRMEDEGVAVEVVTLLAPTLDAVLDPTPPEVLAEWATAFGLHSPVLSERGWGYYLMGDALGDEFAYPSVVIIGPDGLVRDIRDGFATWANYEAIIHDG